MSLSRSIRKSLACLSRTTTLMLQRLSKKSSETDLTTSQRPTIYCLSGRSVLVCSASSTKRMSRSYSSDARRGPPLLRLRTLTRLHSASSKKNLPRTRSATRQLQSKTSHLSSNRPSRFRQMGALGRVLWIRSLKVAAIASSRSPRPLWLTQLLHHLSRRTQTTKEASLNHNSRLASSKP